MGLVQHRLTMIVGGATICTFLISIFFHLFDCMPIRKNWQVKPYPGGKCDLLIRNQPLCQAKENVDQCTLRPLNYILIEALSIVYVIFSHLIFLLPRETKLISPSF